MSTDIVKIVLKRLYQYLEENLPVDRQLAGKLYGWDPPLIQDRQREAILSAITRGRSSDAFQEWYQFVMMNYEEECLNQFNECLRKTSEDAQPMLKHIAEKIEEEIKRVKESSLGESESDDTKPSSSSNSSRDTVPQAESMVSRERSQKKDTPPVEPSVESPPKQAGMEIPESLLGFPGGNLVKESIWDRLKSAICSIRCERVSTGFVVKYDECLYLLTTLHSFPTEEEKKHSQIKEAATQAKYRFFYTEEWTDERATGEEIEGKDIVDQSYHARVKFDQELDIVAVPLVGEFETKKPKIIPISLDMLDKLKFKSWDGCYITIIGHPYGEPLRRSIAAITESRGKLISYNCDTDSGSSGSPVVMAIDQDELVVIGVHRTTKKSKGLNRAALLLHFFQD